MLQIAWITNKLGICLDRCNIHKACYKLFKASLSRHISRWKFLVAVKFNTTSPLCAKERKLIRRILPCSFHQASRFNRFKPPMSMHAICYRTKQISCAYGQQSSDIYSLVHSLLMSCHFTTCVIMPLIQFPLF